MQSGLAVTISLKNLDGEARHKHAVVLCCDGKYLPYAALAITTLTKSQMERDFDICIASLDALEVPPALQGADVRMCQINVGDTFDSLPTSERFSVAAYLRLALADAFHADYDRILYLDCDVMVVGDDLNAVFAFDLHGTPLGAATDNVKWKSPKRATHDQKSLGINGPYFNSGVLLIDCAAFIQQDIKGKCIEIAQQTDAKKIYFDQTLLNLALKNNWARLHPVWNWQWAIVRPMFELFFDPQIVHFITKAKPWSDPKGELPIRYREKARRFFAKYYPDLEIDIAPAATAISKRDVYVRLIKRLTRAHLFVAMFNAHSGDTHKVLTPHQD
jgi:lipopolysaccharide biosynthesis glycosyltransferase